MATNSEPTAQFLDVDTQTEANKKPKKKGLRRIFATVAAVAVVGGGGWFAWGALNRDSQNDNNYVPNPDPVPTFSDTQPGVINAFGQSAARKSPSFDPMLQHWNMARQDQELGLQNPQYAQTYREFMAQFDVLRGLPIAEQVARVNQLVNEQTTYTPDQDLYGRPEYWAAPIETALNHMGDCEDYALLEMEILRYLGVPEDRLFLTAVNAEGNTYKGPDHAILLVNEAPVDQAPAFFVMGDAQPVVPDDNAIIGKTWTVPNGYYNVPAKFVFDSARNNEGYWEVQPGMSKPLAPSESQLVVQAPHKIPKLG